jgi:hypothetical protein
MMQSKLGRLLGACVLLSVALGCGDDTASDRLANGSECTEDTECASGVCEYAGGPRECATPCEDESECPGSLACSRTHRSLGTYCLPLCLRDEAQDSSDAPFACVEGAYVDCEDVPETGTHCTACGCERGAYCTELNDCTPVADVGEACTYNEGCASGNCSAARFDTSAEPGNPVGECVAAPGTRCTDDSGCVCVPNGDEMLCATYCENDQECDGDESCLGDLDTHIGYCHQDCSDGQSCPSGQTCREYREASSSQRHAACNP